MNNPYKNITPKNNSQTNQNIKRKIFEGMKELDMLKKEKIKANNIKQKLNFERQNP